MNVIKTILDNHPEVDEYKVTAITTSSTELFFIKEELQMNRKKDVEHITIVVYKNFEENGQKFKGSSSTKVSPSNTEQEIKHKIDQAILAASFVKNEYYPLEQPSNETPQEMPSSLKDGNPMDTIVSLVKDLYSEDNQLGAFINSTEFFINQSKTHMINSNGIDITTTSVDGEIELITESQGEKEAIELYTVIHFGDYDKEYIKNLVKDTMISASLRSKAVPMPQVENIPVILRGETIRGFYNYYQFAANAGNIYNKLHNNQIGDQLQGEDIKGDTITMTLKPYIKNSSQNKQYDGFGTFLKDTTLVKNGKLIAYAADKKFGHYQNVTPTGMITNFEISPGSYDITELKNEPYLEIVSFSAFQSDPLTGNFGGEFRLGIYFDGVKEIPVTLGSIAGNIKKVQNNFKMSKDQVRFNNFVGPRYLKLENVVIAGN